MEISGPATSTKECSEIMDGQLPWELRDFPVSQSQARRFGTMRHLAGFDQIGDCYALNAARNGVWCYYYTDFPIANIDSDFRVRCWNTKVSGATTLAVAAKRVLLFGGYGDRRIECHLITLEDGDARLDAEASLVLPREIDVARNSVIGRDKQRHVFLEDDWFVFSLA